MEDELLDQKIIQGLYRRETEAWHALYDTYAGRIWALVAHWIVERSDVEDLVQETFLAAARSAKQYDPKRGSLWTWLSSIARNQVAFFFRKQHRKRYQPITEMANSPTQQQIALWLESGEMSPLEKLAKEEFTDMVRAALTELPVEYETLLTARYLDHISIEELAVSGQCSSNAIHLKLTRARRAFRRIFSKRTESPLNDRARNSHES